MTNRVLQKPLIILSVVSLLAVLSTAGYAKDIEQLIIKLSGDISFTQSIGNDGRLIIHPQDWKTSEGRDGRVVAHPVLWSTKEGRDGRLKAIPSEDLILIFSSPVSLALFYEKYNEDKAEALDMLLYEWVNRN